MFPGQISSDNIQWFAVGSAQTATSKLRSRNPTIDRKTKISMCVFEVVYTCYHPIPTMIIDLFFNDIFVKHPTNMALINAVPFIFIHSYLLTILLSPLMLLWTREQSSWLKWHEYPFSFNKPLDTLGQSKWGVNDRNKTNKINDINVFLHVFKYIIE